jgi:hypothetical protein
LSSRSAVKNFNKNPSSNMKLGVEKFTFSIKHDYRWAYSTQCRWRQSFVPKSCAECHVNHTKNLVACTRSQTEGGCYRLRRSIYFANYICEVTKNDLITHKSNHSI